MLTVAYLANKFPSPVEPYVEAEIAELRRRGVSVISGTVREPRSTGAQNRPDVVLQSCGVAVYLRAMWLMLLRWRQIAPLIARVAWGGREGGWQRIKALLHTFVGALYAVELIESGVDHIHVHHGYFGSWIAMTAARMLGVPFSITLHGSDLLLHGTYLDVKLGNCAACYTVSEYNRRYIFEKYPQIDSEKVRVSRLGVEIVEIPEAPSIPGQREERIPSRLTLVAVGRLHAVKNHAFLLRACSQLKDAGLEFECLIAGDGPERESLQSSIEAAGLEREVTLLGHVPRRQTGSLYDRADVVVLTSRSEGIPLVLMEAMARGRIVLAPAITGIPELVIPGKTGFLYEPGSLDDFVRRLCRIRSLQRSNASALDWIRFGAQVHVRRNFDGKKNLESFAEVFLSQLSPKRESAPHEDLVLQQI
jgi:colanic acid/amylovoran biosynthesis glycosyltransferase